MVCAWPPGSHRGATYGPTSAAAGASVRAPRIGSAIEHALQLLADGLQHLHARVALVLRLDQRPRHELGRRALDHVRGGLLVVAPALAVAPVVRRDLEALERRLLPFLEALQLLVARDLQPELADHDAADDELLLELVDLVVGAQPLRRRAEPL